MKDSKAVKLIALAYDEGRTEGFAEGCAYVRAEYEGDSALVKSQAYEAGYAKAQDEAHKVGYQRGLAEGRDRAENTYETGLEAGVKAERERAEAQEPKLSVWFMPIGSGPALGYPPGTNKIKAIKAIREAYGTGEGYSLKEVKDLVEIEPGTLVSCGEPLPQSKAVELYLQLQAAGFEVVLRAQD